MKFNKILVPAVALAALTAACDDQIMEWQPSDSSITAADIPLELKEKIANYDYIKNYLSQYRPNLDVFVGMGADIYLSDEAYRDVVDKNFTGVTLGNAMKMGSLVSSSGKLNFTTVDQVLATLPADMKMYGHVLLWHTQQPQVYLKSLIAPEMVIDASGDVANLLGGDASDFNGGTTGGWSSWGSGKDVAEVDATAGPDGSASLMLRNTGDGNFWEAQCAYTFDTFLDPAKQYVVKFKAKSSTAAGQLQFQYQNGSTYGSQGGYTTFDIGSDWKEYKADIAVTPDDVNRIIFNFGKVGGTYWLDDIQFGEKLEKAHNYCTNGNFADGTTGWTLNNTGDGVTVVDGEGNPSGNAKVLKLVSSASSENAWDLQVMSPKMPTLPGKKINMTFYVKSDQPGKMRVSFSGLKSNYPWMPWLDAGGSWSEAFETVPDTWQRVSLDIFKYNDNDFEEGASEWSMNFDMGYLPGVTYYLDDVQITEIGDATSAPRRAGGVSYKLKTPEEKRAILLDAMEQWIKGVTEHMGDRVYAWDVVNEAIADGSYGWRGIDGVFGTSNSDGVADSAPEESTETGLSLNWAADAGNQHWYWGYYIGKDYAAKAFQFARKYAPNAKLFVNDYNLETSPGKLDALIDFVNYIDANGGQVDGIGTQMHVQAKNLTEAQVDAMFQKMAATGKLVRVTELDVALGTANPSAEELQLQADTYKYIIESYLRNVPEAQQTAITIWGLSDNKKEHEYWLKDQSPNIFDASYGRKIAYKSVCDAIAGRDLSADMKGEDWKNAADKPEKE